MSNNQSQTAKGYRVVLGAGESGTGAAILAKEKGYDVFVSDFGTIKEPYRALLDQNGIKWEDGQHTEELILKADEVIKSPGIPLFPVCWKASFSITAAPCPRRKAPWCGSIPP